MRDFLQLSVAPGGWPPAPTACSRRREIFLGLRARTGAIVAPVGPTAGAGPGPKIGPKWRDDDACQTSRGPAFATPVVGSADRELWPPAGAMRWPCLGGSRAGPALTLTSTGLARAVLWARCAPARAGGPSGDSAAVAGDDRGQWPPAMSLRPAAKSGSSKTPAAARPAQRPRFEPGVRPPMRGRPIVR
jgi:hypothetical protein